MYPQSHFLFPFFVGELLVKLGYVDQKFVLLAVLVGVFVDLDHLLHHFFVTGKISLTATADDAFKKHIDDRTFLHHKDGIALVTVLLLIGYASFPYYSYALALGYYSHMLLDHVTANGRLLDNRTDKDYLGKTKPIIINVCGYLVHIAKFELVSDALLMIGLFALFFL